MMPWKAVLIDNIWLVRAEDGQTIASMANSEEAENNAKLMAASPYMFEALKAVVGLIGDEDLPDNGELNGAAISDMARSSIEVASGTNYLTSAP